MEDANSRQRLSELFLNLDTVFYNSTTEKIANIGQIERDGISAITFKAAQPHFLYIDVFVAVAVVAA